MSATPIAETCGDLALIPNTSFTEGEARQLARLLGLVAKDGGFWPTQECFEAANRATRRPAAEIVITRQNPNTGKLEVLLVMYGKEGAVLGNFHPHWTLPGGFLLLNEDIAATVRRAGKREIGTDVEWTGKILMVRAWAKGEHANGAVPLSLYVECRAEVVETEDLRFWPVDALPELDNRDGVHCRQLNAHFNARRA